MAQLRRSGIGGDGSCSKGKARGRRGAQRHRPGHSESSGEHRERLKECLFSVVSGEMWSGRVKQILSGWDGAPKFRGVER